MDKVLAKLLEMIESKSVPTVVKIVLLLVAVAAGMSTAGFPVVEYAEKLAAELWEHPRLFGGLVGMAVAVTVVQLSRPLFAAAQRFAILTARNKGIDAVSRVLLIVIVYVLTAGFVLGTTMFFIGFLAWAVS